MLRHLSGAVVGCLVFALSTNVAAQDAPPPATPEEIASAREIADTLIKADNAGAYFTNITDDGTPTVQHTRSGLICSLSEGEGSRVVVFPRQGGANAGDDVGCASRYDTLGLDLTIYATRYVDPMSAEEVLASAAYAIEQRFETAKPFDGEISLVSVEGMDQPLAAAYVYESPAGPMLTLALVSHRGEWSYKVRATGPVEQAAVVSLIAGMTLLIGMDVLDTDE
jgi:hypothetical protein